MKAAIALLADFAAQNMARKIVYQLYQQSGIEFFGSILPAHISLKQPFPFESMDKLEAWFDALAARTAPFDIQLDSVYHSAWEGYGILGFQVVETPMLRELHNQINRELPGVVENPAAPHDGDEYRFHLTIELGKIGPDDPYRAWYDSLPEKAVQLTFRAQQMALFIYADRPIQSGSFIVYRVKSLSPKSRNDILT